MSTKRWVSDGEHGIGAWHGVTSTRQPGRGRVLAVVLTPGQRHERAQLGSARDAIRVPRPGDRGRPRKRPDHSIADKGYS